MDERYRNSRLTLLLLTWAIATTIAISAFLLSLVWVL